MTTSLVGHSDAPGYAEAVGAVARLARRPRCSDWGEGLTEPRCRAILDAAYPVVAEATLAWVIETLLDAGHDRAADFIAQEVRP